MDQANTLQAFIEKLHSEGVEAGLNDADDLRAAAAAESAAVVAEARENARAIVARAEERAATLVDEAKGEISLAVRDAELELRDALERSLTSLLQRWLQPALEDPDLLARLLVEIVGADADAPDPGLEVEVRSDLVERLAAVAPRMLGEALAEGGRVDVREGLRTAGFECRVHDSVIEVTPESVAEKLVQLLSPRLRALLRTAADRGPLAAQ